jgi:hypothetical protein
MSIQPPSLPATSSSSTSSTNGTVVVDDDGPDLVKGYAYKLFRPRFPHGGGIRKRRLVVLDKRLGKLFVVKGDSPSSSSSEKDVLEQVDLSSASFTMDHGDSGFFSIQ